MHQQSQSLGSSDRLRQSADAAEDLAAVRVVGGSFAERLPGTSRLRPEDWLLAFAVALLGPILVVTQGAGGPFDQSLQGVGLEAKATIPHLLFMAFQATFAIITAALVSKVGILPTFRMPKP